MNRLRIGFKGEREETLKLTLLVLDGGRDAGLGVLAFEGSNLKFALRVHRIGERSLGDLLRECKAQTTVFSQALNLHLSAVVKDKRLDKA